MRIQVLSITEYGYEGEPVTRIVGVASSTENAGIIQNFYWERTKDLPDITEIEIDTFPEFNNITIANRKDIPSRYKRFHLDEEEK